LLSLEPLQPAELDLGGANIIGRVTIENPNNQPLPFPELSWEFSVGGASYHKGVIKEGEPLGPGSVRIVEIPLQLNYAALLPLVSGVDELPCVLAVDGRFKPARGKAPLVHAESAGTIPRAKAPALSFDGITIRRLTLQKADLTLNWTIKNPNSFPLSLEHFVYSLTVNGDPWSSGASSELQQLKARGAASIPLETTIGSLHLVGDILKIINLNAPAAFECSGELGVSADLPLLRLDLPFSFSGNSAYGGVGGAGAYGDALFIPAD
jgi:LEA14-like dessication related protein